jgi:predicted alpha/beta superfamily hydrolase
MLRVLLPDGYDAPENRSRQYPVLYLADGQNLFDPATSVFGPSEWRVDETVQRLIAASAIPPLIVVGVDDAGRSARSHEYLPYPDTANVKNDPAYDPDPQGKRYPEFLLREVMPFVQERYRIARGPESTGIGGSSYGALISAYVVATHPGVFGRALLESPTVAVYDSRILRDLAAAQSLPARVFVGIGTNEDSRPNCDPQQLHDARNPMLVGAERLAATLRSAGLDSTRLKVVVDPCAAHTHAAWARRLPDALTFLFAGATR